MATRLTPRTAGSCIWLQQRLEPCAGKLACTVLRRAAAGNSRGLSDPTSHPFIERLIGTIRIEYHDRLFFWNAQDLERKLAAFQHYYNEHRAHLSLKGSTPLLAIDNAQTQHAKLDNYSWQSHCNGLYLTPIAA